MSSPLWYLRLCQHSRGRALVQAGAAAAQV